MKGLFRNVEIIKEDTAGMWYLLLRKRLKSHVKVPDAIGQKIFPVPTPPSLVVPICPRLPVKISTNLISEDQHPPHMFSCFTTMTNEANIKAGVEA